MRSLVLLACFLGCSAPPAPSKPPDQTRANHGPGEGQDPGAVEFARPPHAGPGPVTAPASLPTRGPECSKQQCPNAPAYPTEECADRVHVGGRGPCVRFANGQCSWTGLVCPAPTSKVTCAAASCGLPVPAEWLCPDGKTIARFSCVPTARGTCGATYQPCRGNALTPPPTPRPPPPPQPPLRSCAPLPSDRELATWPIDSVCGPGQGPDPPPQKHFKTLRDGTHIVERAGRCMRVQYEECNTKCLPPDARIATPAGDLLARDVRAGMTIWTLGIWNQRVPARVEKITSVAVTGTHHVVRVVLADGRTAVASPEHPVLGDRTVQELRVGDTYDGAVIVELEFLRYTRTHTYDLLPGGATGVYWVDGIPMRSTIQP